MKTIILKNVTANNITISSLGLTIIKNDSVNIDSSELLNYSMNSELFTLIESGSIKVNNGMSDLSASDAKMFLQPVEEGIFSNYIHAHSKSQITNFSHSHDDLYYTKNEIGTTLGEYYTKQESTTVFSPNIHNHDSSYYKKSEIDSNLYTRLQLKTLGQAEVLWGNLLSIPTTFTPSTHLHDDRYFTESEITTLLTGKSDTTHLHDDRYYTKSNMQTSGSAQLHWDNVTSKPTVFNPSSHTHDDRYFTESEITTNYYTKTNMQTSGSALLHWDNLTNKPLTYPATTHLHDDRYYTESESDAKYSILTHTHIKSNITDFIEGSYVHTSGDETISGNKTFNGSVTFNGTVTTINSQTINLADNIILLNSDYTGSTPTEKGGIEVKRGTIVNASLIWDEGVDKWKAGLLGSEVELSLLGHSHDDLYFTETEITNNFSPITHTHDDRYYTENELDNGQLNNIYYTESEVDAKFANFKTVGVKEVVDQYEDLLSITNEIPGTVYIVRERSGVITGVPQLYTDTPNTIIHMKFDGNTTDTQGHTNTGGGTALTYEPGKVAQAGVFNNSFRTYANNPDLNVTNAFSCGVWLYPTQLDPTKSYSLFDKYPINGSQSGWGLIIEEGGRIQIWAMGPNQPFIRVRTYSKLRINQWTHIGLSFEGTIIKLWKNAVAVAELPFNGDIGANTAPLDIGRYYNNYLYGKLDDLFYTKDIFSYSDFMRIVNNGPFADYRDEGFWKWDGTQWVFLIQNMSGIYHNELLGTNREEMMHLTKNEFAGLTKGLDTDLHLHDGRYYTEGESDAKYSTLSHSHSEYYTKTEIQTSGQSQLHWDNLINKPSTFTPSIHSHNDLYYTEGESDAKYSILTHLHDDRYYTEGESDAKYSILTHLHDDRYFTETEITTNYYSKVNMQTSGSAQLHWDNITNKPDLTLHTHDDRYFTEGELTGGSLDGRYFTETEITTNYYTKSNMQTSGSAQLHWNNITSKPVDFTPSSHTHDDRYYTESEITTNYYSKVNMQTSGQAQLHWDNITSKPSTFTPSTHAHDDRYYTETEITTNYYTKSNMQTSGQALLHWGNLTNKPVDFTPSVHTHDDLYYTEAESNAKYSPILHTHIKSNITDFIEANYVHTSGDETISGAKIFTGNITFSGTVTTINSQTINLADNIILLNSDYTGSTPTEKAGIEIERGTITSASLLWDESVDKWKAGLLGSEIELSLLGHTHDDLYYTKAWIDNNSVLYYTKTNLQTSGQSQLHWDNITSKPSTFTPSSHTHDDRYFTETEITNNFSPITHTHDDRYFTESEINTKLGQINIAYVVANDTTTNITATELETLTNGSNADGLHTHANIGGGGTLNDAYGTWGEGREIDTDKGPVQLNASDGFAPLRLTEVDYTPNQWLSGGEIVFKNKEMWYRDVDKVKFLSFAMMSAQFTSNSNGFSGYLYYGNAQMNSETGFSMPWDGVIVGISGRSQNNTTSNLEIRKNGSNEQTIYWADGTNYNNHIQNDELNINFTKDDDITIYCNNTGSKPNKPCITLFIRKRL